jgi:hypothetical protein
MKTDSKLARRPSAGHSRVTAGDLVFASCFPASGKSAIRDRGEKPAFSSFELRLEAGNIIESKAIAR